MAESCTPDSNQEIQGKRWVHVEKNISENVKQHAYLVGEFKRLGRHARSPSELLDSAQFKKKC